MVETKEMRIRDTFKVLFSYKLFIFIIVMSSVILSNIYLFFTSDIYRTSAKIEVITFDKSNRNTNDLLQNTFYANKEVDKEIEKLVTFEINQKVIKDMNLQVQFFKHKAYHKYDEIYEESVPIQIKKIKNLKDEVIRKMIKLTPLDKGYHLEIVHFYHEQLFHKLFKKKLLQFDDVMTFYPYGKVIKTKYFDCLITQTVKLDEPIYFKLNGDSRDIYDNLVFGRLSVSQKNKEAPILEILYEDNIPKRAMDYVNKLVEFFNKEGRIEKSQRNNQISKYLKDRLSTNSKELKEAEEALEKYKIENRAIKISTQTDLLMRELSTLDISISDIRLKKIMISNVLSILENGVAFNSIGPLLKELDDVGTLSLLDSLQLLEIENTKLSAEYTDEYPDLSILHQQIDIIKQKIIKNLNNLELLTRNKEKSLEKSKAKKEMMLARLPVYETNIVNLNRRYELLLNMNDYLARKENENNTIKSAIISDYKTIEKAYEVKIPIKPKKSLVVILSLVLGITIGVILALLRHALSNKIRNLENIKNHTSLPIYGIVSFSRKSKESSSIEVFKQSQSFFSNSFRELRTNLQFKSQSDNSKVFLLTSMSAKEGKSTVVLNLSAIFQLSGYRTLIIDLDLRKPSLDKYFDIEVTSGMSGYLAGRDNISEIIYSTAYPNLDIIPVGEIPINPSELILSSNMEKLFKKLKEQYDYIIIDTPHLNLLKDTITLMKYADINLVVLNKKGIRKSSLARLESLADKYQQNIGFVINRGSKNDKLDNLF